MEENIYYKGQSVRKIHPFVFNGHNYVVCDDANDFIVVSESDLQKLEDTYQYKKLKGLREEVKRLETEKESIIKDIKKKAVDSLSFTMKLNSAFSKDNEMSSIGIMLAGELSKIISKENI